MELKIDDKPLSFAEAMKIRKRLCASMRDVCKNCPLSSDNNDTTESCDDFMLDHPDIAEPILKEWMAEHPLKTNKDKFAEVFGEIEKFGKCKFAICSAVPCSRCDWWQHFKGNVVEIIGFSENTEWNTYSVVYKLAYSPAEYEGRLFHRPFNMFMSEVDREKYPDAKQKYRFERIG